MRPSILLLMTLVGLDYHEHTLVFESIWTAKSPSTSHDSLSLSFEAYPTSKVTNSQRYRPCVGTLRRPPRTGLGFLFGSFATVSATEALLWISFASCVRRSESLSLQGLRLAVWRGAGFS